MNWQGNKWVRRWAWGRSFSSHLLNHLSFCIIVFKLFCLSEPVSSTFLDHIETSLKQLKLSSQVVIFLYCHQCHPLPAEANCLQTSTDGQWAHVNSSCHSLNFMQVAKMPRFCSTMCNRTNSTVGAISELFVSEIELMIHRSVVTFKELCHSLHSWWMNIEIGGCGRICILTLPLPCAILGSYCTPFCAQVCTKFQPFLSRDRFLKM